MKNMRILLKLMGAITLSATATSSVIACGNNTKIETFTKTYANPVEVTAVYGELKIKEEKIGQGYMALWNDKALGQIALMILDDKSEAINKLDDFLNVTLIRPTPFNPAIKPMNNIKFTYSKKIEETGGIGYIVESISEIN